MAWFYCPGCEVRYDVDEREESVFDFLERHVDTCPADRRFEGTVSWA